MRVTALYAQLKANKSRSVTIASTSGVAFSKPKIKLVSSKYLMPLIAHLSL